jgi:ProP effector
VLEQLFALYPKMFGARFLPLKLGAYQDLLAAHPEAFKKEDLKVALGLHARSTRYLEAREAPDARAQAITRILAAIDNSGLSREDYAQRVRGQDEANNALLDEALAEAGRRAAKGEALLRAFTASGKSEAEFADMYGMDPREVAATLERARR